MAVKTHCRPDGTAPGVGEIVPCSIGPWNTTTLVPSTGPYRGVVVETHGLDTFGDPVLSSVTTIAGRTDAGATYTVGSATILDSACVAGDVGASIWASNTAPPLNIPVTAVVQTVTPGVSFTVQNNASGLPTASGTGVTIGGDGQDGMVKLLNNDGWIVLGVPYPEDDYVTTPGLGIQNDILNDPGTPGSRYFNTNLLWWDHVVEYIARTYGPAMPIVPLGASWGGYHTLMVTQHKTATIAAYVAHIPATIVSNVSVQFVNPCNFSPVSFVVNGYTRPGCPGGTAGMDIGPNALSALGLGSQGVVPPGFVSYGESDNAVGWAATTLAAGNTADVSTFSNSGILHVTDATRVIAGAFGPFIWVDTAPGTAVIAIGSYGQFNVSAISGNGSVVTVTTAAPHGYTSGQQAEFFGFTGSFVPLNSATFIRHFYTITVTGASTFTIADSTTGTIGGSPVVDTGPASNQLTNLTTLSGSGVPTLGGAVIQSNTDAIITNAVAAGKPVTRHGTVGEGHEFRLANTIAFAAFLVAQEAGGYLPKIH